jgi:hypothetical protein
LLPDVSPREVAILAPILGLILVFGVAPRLLTDKIQPTANAVVARVDPAHAQDAAPILAPVAAPATASEAAPATAPATGIAP